MLIQPRWLLRGAGSWADAAAIAPPLRTYKPGRRNLPGRLGLTRGRLGPTRGRLVLRGGRILASGAGRRKGSGSHVPHEGSKRPRGSRRSPEIARDRPRSPEIAQDRPRSPEIAASRRRPSSPSLPAAPAAVNWARRVQRPSRRRAPARRRSNSGFGHRPTAAQSGAGRWRRRRPPWAGECRQGAPRRRRRRANLPPVAGTMPARGAGQLADGDALHVGIHGRWTRAALAYTGG
jgi:hypothetical protein